MAFDESLALALCVIFNKSTCLNPSMINCIALGFEWLVGQKKSYFNVSVNFINETIINKIFSRLIYK